MLKFSSESNFGINVPDNNLTDVRLIQELVDNWTTVSDALLDKHYGIFNSIYDGEGAIQPHATLFKYFNAFYALNAKTCNKSAAPFISYCIQAINARPNEAGFMDNFNPMRLTPNPDWKDTTHAYNVSVVLVKRGMNYFDACTTWATEHHIDPLSEDILKLMANPEFPDHKMRGYCSSNKAVIVTNHWDQNWANRLYALAPSIFPDLKYLIEKDNICRNIFAALYQNDAELLRPVLTWFLDYWVKAQYDIVYNKIAAKLTQCATSDLNEAERRQSNAKSQVDSALRSYQQYLQEFVEAEKNLLRFQTEEIKTDLSLIDYLKKANNITVVQQQPSDFLRLEISTPITNFREEDLKSWYRRAVANSITCRPELAALLYDALINHKYQLIVKTRVSMPYQRNQHSWAMNQADLYIGNPHLIHYNCWHNTQRQADAALLRGDFISAINYVIAACATITFTDSTVVNALMGDLATYTEQPCWLDTEGNMLSTRTLEQKYKDFLNNNGPEIVKALEEEVK